MRHKLLRVGIVSTLVVASVGVTLWLSPDLVARLSYAAEHGQALAARERLDSNPARAAVDFRQVAKAIAPSVVNISTVTTVRVGPRMPGSGSLRGPLDDFFGEEFFHRFFGHTPVPRQAEQRSLGTGVIVSEDGYIVTNNHVIRGADAVTVNLSDGRNFEASVVGSDSKTDLAVLRIEAKDLLPAELGNSEKLEVGEWVLAVGNPFGLRNTFTSGIISAKGRSDVGIARYEDFIQTDAAINPGNSGGPLVDMSGKVIGINTAIASRSGGYQGIGFAIPSEMVRDVMESLIDEGRVVRGWLGVYIQDLDRKLAESFDFDGEKGIVVSQVVDGGPAAKAGLRSGDIVISMGGENVLDTKGFSSRVASLSPGTKADLVVFRNGERHRLSVEIGDYPDDEHVALGSKTGNLGLTLETLTPALAARHRLETKTGVLITAVEAGSLASRAGLSPGDAILAVNGEEVRDLETFRAAVGKRSLADGVRLLVESRGHRRFHVLQQRG